MESALGIINSKTVSTVSPCVSWSSLPGSVKNLSSIGKNRHQFTRMFYTNLEGLAKSDTGPYQLID